MFVFVSIVCENVRNSLNFFYHSLHILYDEILTNLIHLHFLEF
jgi:hypothetical protein